MNLLQISDLRRELRTKFPSAHQHPFPKEPEKRTKEDWEFKAGKLSEVIVPEISSGMSLLLSKLLQKKHSLPLVLIDSRDSFDPASYSNEQCSRVLWIRCKKTQQALQSADLLLRDGNLPLVLFDLHLVCARDLRKIPRHFWHRLRLQARDSGVALVTFTPCALVPSAHQRLILQSTFSLQNLELKTPTLSITNTEQQPLLHKA